jgi:hypothetical protein
VQAKFKPDGEAAALDNLTKQDEKRLQDLSASMLKMRAIVPPAEYAHLHSGLIAFLSTAPRNRGPELQ